MLNSKILPIAFITAGLIGGTAMIAHAQETAATPSATAETAAPEAKPGMLAAMKAKFRGAGKRGEMMQQIFTEVDADKNGSVTQDEVNAFRTAKVAAADTSKDGAINLEEFAVAYNERMRSRMVDAFQNLDDDGNGSITTAELDARFGNVVAKMDRNGDGAISKEDRPARDGKRKFLRDNQDGGQDN